MTDQCTAENPDKQARLHELIHHSYVKYGHTSYNGVDISKVYIVQILKCPHCGLSVQLRGEGKLG